MVVRVPMRVSDEQLAIIGEANPGWRVELVDLVAPSLSGAAAIIDYV